MVKKDLGITEIRGAKENIPDLQVYGDGDAFALLCKASSKAQGWMKSTKVCNVPGGCLVQVTTQQENPDGSYAVAEALTYVPGVQLDKDSTPRQFVSLVQDPSDNFTNPWIVPERIIEAQRRADIFKAVELTILDRVEARGLLGFPDSYSGDGSTG